MHGHRNRFTLIRRFCFHWTESFSLKLDLHPTVTPRFEFLTQKLSDKTGKVKNIIIEEVRKDMDSQRTLIKNLTSDLKDQREELEVAKRWGEPEKYFEKSICIFCMSINMYVGDKISPLFAPVTSKIVVYQVSSIQFMKND